MKFEFNQINDNGDFLRYSFHVIPKKKRTNSLLSRQYDDDEEKKLTILINDLADGSQLF